MNKKSEHLHCPNMASGATAGPVSDLIARPVKYAVVLAIFAWAFSIPPSVLGQSEMRLDDFENTHEINQTPAGWDFDKVPFTDDEGIHFRFVHDGGDHFIHLKSGAGNSYVLAREDFEFSLEEYAILEWEWRVVTLPKGGDVRIEEKDDQAGSICIVVDPGTFGADETLCYIWENMGPRGAELTSTKREESKYIILRAGDTDTLGEWQKERRNFQEDFKRVFGYLPTDDSVIGMQIDSDSTESSAEVFFRNIVVKK